MRFLKWLLSVSLVASVQAADPVLDPEAINPVWAEQYLRDQYPAVLEDSDKDHVISVYYFGRVGSRNLLGLERVRGDNYEQFFTLLIFEGQQLMGYYPHVLSFPSLLQTNGDVQFPLGVEAYGENSGEPLRLTAKLPEFENLFQGLGELKSCSPWRIPARN